MRFPCITDYRSGDELGNGPDMEPAAYTDEDAYDDAVQTMHRDPYSIAWWISQQIPFQGAVDIGIVADRLDAGLSLTVPELLALAFNDSIRSVAAISLLREAYSSDPMIRRDAEILASELYARQPELCA